MRLDTQKKSGYASLPEVHVQLARKEAEQRDLEIINRRADSLNAEAEDVLTYQVPQ